MTDPKPVIIIAEAAQGFEGDPTLARLLVKAAAAAGADVVKFQLVLADELATPAYEFYPLFRRLEMTEASWGDVAQLARESGLGLAFDVFGPTSLRTALGLGAGHIKLHASDFFNRRLCDLAVESAPEVLVSTGGILPDEIAALLNRYEGDAAARITLMAGFQAEPTATGDNNIARLESLRARFPHFRLGFMDHADGESDESGWLALLALPYRVSILEKHITLDRNLGLEDSVSAATPSEFATFVARVRAAESALGSGSLELSPGEQAYRNRSVKVVVATRAVAPGREVDQDSVMLLRAPTESGRQPLRRFEEVLDRKAVRGLSVGSPVYADDVQ